MLITELLPYTSGSELPSYEVKLAAFDSIKALPGTETYSQKQHLTWCSARKQLQVSRAVQTRVANTLVSQPPKNKSHPEDLLDWEGATPPNSRSATISLHGAQEWHIMLRWWKVLILSLNTGCDRSPPRRAPREPRPTVLNDLRMGGRRRSESRSRRGLAAQRR